MHQPRIGRMRDRLRLHRRVDDNPLEILGRDRARLVRHRKALLDEGHQLFLAQALAPACQRRAVERDLITEAQFAAKELEIRILDPPRAENFGQPHQRMTHVDDLIERRTKQVLLAIVARSCHRPQYR